MSKKVNMYSVFFNYANSTNLKILYETHYWNINTLYSQYNFNRYNNIIFLWNEVIKTNYYINKKIYKPAY